MFRFLFGFIYRIFSFSPFPPPRHYEWWKCAHLIISIRGSTYYLAKIKRYLVTIGFPRHTKPQNPNLHFIKSNILGHDNAITPKCQNSNASYSMLSFIVEIILLCVYRLSVLLGSKRDSERVYIGCMKKGPVVNDPALKW